MNFNYLKNLEAPIGKIDVVLDTDAYNEIDDQYAISYLLKSEEKLNTKAIFAAPFTNTSGVNGYSENPKEGMEKSYDEILKLLKLGDFSQKPLVFKGSESYLEDEKTPVISPASEFLAEFAMNYTGEKPLYVVGIGAITNVASAILINPKIVDKIVIVWLGGHSVAHSDTYEFNMFQDIAAARIIFGCGAPLVHLPALGVVSHFTFSKCDLEYWLKGKNKLCDYLVEHTIKTADVYAKGKPWTRVIWDVCAIGWLLNDNNRFMRAKLIHSPIPEYDSHYAFDDTRPLISYVYEIFRDSLAEDFINKLTK